MSRGLETLKKARKPFDGSYLLNDEQYQAIEKELKALEIIKEMLNSDIGYKLNANSRKIFKEIFESLPKEKQDLLKEVLL